MATDPVCGMNADPAKARHLEHAGKTYYFCSASCETKFQAAPDKYIGATPAPAGHAHQAAHAAPAKVTYRCPMHPEVQQNMPGKCPKCGMALQPDTASPSAAPVGKPVAPGALYTCPMHPEIVRNKPGDCPLCGMALVPIAGTGDADDSELRDLKRRLWIGDRKSVV